MKNPKLKANKRKLVGRKVKQLRADGILPSNVYGKKVKSKSIEVIKSDFEKVFKTAGETNIVDLVLDGKNIPVLIHNVQNDPVSDVPIHVDFLQVNLKEKVTAQVPVDLVNESPAEKSRLGTLVQYLDELEVEALPMDLPEKFDVDLSKLVEVGDMIQVKDIKAEKDKVEIKNDGEQILVKIDPLRKEEEPEAPPMDGEEEAEETEGEEVEKDTTDSGEPSKEEKKE